MSEDLQISRKFRGIWIPAEIWLDKTLSIQEKTLWGEIDSLYSDSHEGCFASDEYLMKFMGVKRAMLQRYLKNLKDKGFIETVRSNGRGVVRKAILPETNRQQKSNENRKETSTIVDIASLQSETSHTKKKHPRHISTKSIDKNKVSCSDGSSNTSEPDIIFSFEKGFLGITPLTTQVWKEAYPDINIEKEIAKARSWCLANQKKAKLKKNWKSFLTKWLAKAADQNEWKTVSKAQQDTIGNQGEIISNKEMNAASARVSFSFWEKDGIIRFWDDRLEVKIRNAWKPIAYKEYGFDEQVNNALRTGGHI